MFEEVGPLHRPLGSVLSDAERTTERPSRYEQIESRGSEVGRVQLQGKVP
jgi:hypothetical protein